jgi:hypothetical protein
VLTGDFLPWRAHMDAGNHLLATAAARLSFSLFGDSPFALRLFSVFCFGIWAWYTWRITRMLVASPLRAATSAALLLTPFLFEFFSLFRGYGPALAFLLMALHHCMAYMQRARRIDLLLLLAAAALACAASLTVLLLGLLLFAVATLRTWVARRADPAAWAMLLFVGALPLAALVLHGSALSAGGHLYYGSHEGIVNGTLASLGEWVLGIRWPLLGASLLLLPLLFALAAIRRSQKRIPLALLMLLFTGELIGRVVLGEAFGVLYPTDRTAMHLIPAAILLFAYAVDSGTSLVRTSIAAGLLALLPARTLVGMNMNRTSYWPEQSVTENIYDAAETQQRNSNRPLLIGGYHQSACLWAYASMRRGALLNFIDVNGFPQTTCDLLLLDPDHFTVPDGFDRIVVAPHGRAALYERTSPLRTTLQSDSALASFTGDPEYFELPVPEAEALTESEWLIELDARFSSDLPVLRLRIVVEVKDSAGGVLHYEANDFERLRAAWHGERLHAARRIPRFLNAPARVVVYLWNPLRQEYRVDSARVRLSRVEP